ncbi:L-threonine ammonia-lyase-like isoform X2 [Tachypleus tridentatus]|uniref:L-threonine ammonia-lyase-like isoform X2 n=1 Tax=Tachypleus tridentatus TaxID=6853 RepID=UPI003FD183CE
MMYNKDSLRKIAMPAEEVNFVCPYIGDDKSSSPSPTPMSNGNGGYLDPICDPSNPIRIKFQDICSAAYTIKGGVISTPCMRSHMSSTLGCNVYFKKDFLQYTGSFKERGARYMLMMMAPEHKHKGVIAASAGNHALALSYHGQKLGIPVTVVMPIIAPIMKITMCEQFGANIIIKGTDIGESKEHALQLAEENELVYVNGYDHPHIIAGQGTMGLEIIDQVPDLDAVIVPVGGGGLIAGLALAVKSLKPEVKVIGVESERCPSFTSAMNAGHPVQVRAGSTLADGLAVPKVGVNAFHTASHLVDKVLVVKESFIALSILRLVEMDKSVVEGAGACGLAALIAGLLPELQGKNVVLPLCGGNIDTTVLGRCLERGLAVDGRLIKFTVTVSDRPGGISELVKLISMVGVSIKDIIHERAWLTRDIFSVQVKVVGETRDRAHAQELENTLRSNYNEVHFVSTGDTS